MIWMKKFWAKFYFDVLKRFLGTTPRYIIAQGEVKPNPVV